MNRLEKRIGAMLSLGVLVAGCGSQADPVQEAPGELGQDPDAVFIGTGEGVFTSAAELGARESEPDSNAEVAEQEVVTLNRFSVGETEIEFQELVEADGSSSLLIVETAPIGLELLTHRLKQEHGGLTALETFYALAPEAAVPHEHLVTRHAEQSELLNRSDASVRRVDFDREQRVEKSTTSCWNDLLATSAPWIYAGMLFNRSGNVAVCAGESFGCGYYVTNTQVDMLWCNESSNPLERRWAIGEADTNNGAWQSERTLTNLPAGQQQGMGIWPQPDSRRYYMRGISSGPKYHMGFLIHEEE